MNSHIVITRGSYGFGHNWSLVCSTPKVEKVFYLGQDEKVCRRILGLTARGVIDKIGTAKIDEGTRGNKRLAKLLVEHFQLNGNNIKKIESWQLSAE